MHDVVDHIEHIIKVAGVDHVGLGSDYDGIGTVPKQLEDVSCYPYITQELLNRGHKREDIVKVLGTNVLRDARRKPWLRSCVRRRRWNDGFGVANGSDGSADPSVTPPNLQWIPSCHRCSSSILSHSPRKHLPLAPRLAALAQAGWDARCAKSCPRSPAPPRRPCSPGCRPSQHGIVGNGWLYRDTMEVRFWQQSNRLLQAEPRLRDAAKRAQATGKPFRCAKLFWWFNQGRRRRHQRHAQAALRRRRQQGVRHPRLPRGLERDA